jgi:predicted Zn-ribbon and HTH transcriptional regulator
MLPPGLTPRQYLMQILTGTVRSAQELARLLAMPERQVEEHLAHIVRSLAHDPARRFFMEPARCQQCGFIFRERRRLTCPSRCPTCRSEAICPARYGITNRRDSQGL